MSTISNVQSGERIPQSVAKRVAFPAVLASDHYTIATGKTIAITISKNAAAFGNPSGGATNATEIASGWYYVDLSTTDTGTAGPLIVRGTEATPIDDIAILFFVVDAHNAGFDGVPSVTAAASGGLPTVDANNSVKTQSKLKKNTAFNNFEFVMRDTSGVPTTGLTVTSTRSIDGGSFAACANSASEISNGVYKINLATTDVNGDCIVLKFTATGAAPTLVEIFTNP